MKWTYLAFIAVVLFSGCTLLKRNTKTSNESSAEQSSILSLKDQTTTSNIKDGESMIWKQNGIDANYKIHYYPKGQFRMGMDGLFMGEFDSILLTGRQKQLNSTLGKSTLREQNKAVSNTNFNQKSKLNNQQKSVQKMSIPDVKIIGSIIVLITTAFFVIRFLKKHP